MKVFKKHAYVPTAIAKRSTGTATSDNIGAEGIQSKQKVASGMMTTNSQKTGKVGNQTSSTHAPSGFTSAAIIIKGADAFKTKHQEKVSPRRGGTASQTSSKKVI